MAGSRAGFEPHFVIRAEPAVKTRRERDITMQRHPRPPLYMSSPSTFVGETEHCVDDLPFDDELRAALREVGVTRYRTSELGCAEMARRALPATRGGGAVSHLLLLSSRDDWPGDIEPFSSGRFAQDNGLGEVEVWGIGLAQCAGLHSAIQLAGSLVDSGRAQSVMVSCVEAARSHTDRLVFAGASVHSDAAASFIVSPEPRGPVAFRILSSESTISPALSQIDPTLNVVRYMAGFSDGCLRAARACAQAASMSLGDFQWLILNNYNNRLNRGVAELLGFTWEKVGHAMIATERLGHALSADNLINLESLESSGRLAAGDTILLLATGPNRWGATALEVVANP